MVPRLSTFESPESPDQLQTRHSSEHSAHPRKRLLLTVATLLALCLSVGLLSGCESTNEDRAAVLNAVNASRAASGLPPVAENVTLDVKADAWAQKMRDACKIWHSTLRDGAPANWQKLGENVGRGGSIAVIHDAYMNSPGHRANILDPAFNQMGVAAVWGTCNGARTAFTVHVFMKA